MSINDWYLDNKCIQSLWNNIDNVDILEFLAKHDDVRIPINRLVKLRKEKNKIDYTQIANEHGMQSVPQNSWESIQWNVPEIIKYFLNKKSEVYADKICTYLLKVYESKKIKEFLEILYEKYTKDYIIDIFNKKITEFEDEYCLCMYGNDHYLDMKIKHCKYIISIIHNEEYDEVFVSDEEPPTTSYYGLCDDDW